MNGPKVIKEIKHFNRFYLRIMGLFSLYSDQSSYSATEAMILFEINSTKNCTASYLSEYFLFDKGYISRTLTKLQKKDVIQKIPSTEDRRIQYLEMTKKGVGDLNDLKINADASVERMIGGITQKEVSVLTQSMKQIEMVLKHEQ